VAVTYIISILNSEVDCATAQAVSYWPLTAEVCVGYQARPCGICGGQSDIWSGFQRVRLFSPVIIIPLIPDTQSCIILLTDSAIKSQT